MRAAPCSLPCAPWTCSILTCFKRFVVAQNVVSRRSWLAPASTDNCVSRAEARGGLPFLLAQPSLRQRHITVDLYRDLQSLSPSRAHCHARVHASVCVRARARACACVCTLRACMLRTYTTPSCITTLFCSPSCDYALFLLQKARAHASERERERERTRARKAGKGKGLREGGDERQCNSERERKTDERGRERAHWERKLDPI